MRRSGAPQLCFLRGLIPPSPRLLILSDDQALAPSSRRQKTTGGAPPRVRTARRNVQRVFKVSNSFGGGLTPCSDWPKDRDIILQPFSVLFFIVVYLTAVFGFVFHRQKRGRDRARQPQTLRRRRSAETARAPLPRGSPGTPLVRGDLSPSLGAHTYRGFWEHCLHEKLEPAAVAPNQDFWENAADARVSWRQRSKKPLCAPQS